MTIAPVMNIEIEKMGPLRILMRIDYGVYLCNCTVYSYVLKQHTQHAFVYERHFPKKKRRVHAVVQSLIMEHMHPSMY